MTLTDAAKSLAYVSITLSLAVLLVGCSLAAGREGEQGIAGSKGDRGVPGATGVDALEAKPGVAAVLVNFADLVDGDGHAFLNAETGARTDLPAGKTGTLGPVDLSAYFVGGKAPIKYTLPASLPPTAAPLGGKIEGSSYRYDVTVPATPATIFLPSTVANTYYTTGWTGTIVALDARDVEARSVITFRLNRHPRLTMATNLGSAQKGASDGAIAQPPPAGAFLLGTQVFPREVGTTTRTRTPLALRAGLHKACPGYHECELDVFSDDDAFTVAVERMTREGAATTAYVGQAAAAGGNLKLTGIKSTWKNATAQHVPVQVDLKATDGKGLTRTATVYVAVDQQPELTAAGERLDRKTFTVDEANETIHASVSSLFSDVETSTLTYTGNTADVRIATIAINNNAIEVTPVGLGTVRIEVTARDVRNQWAQVRFFANVTKLP